MPLPDTIQSASNSIPSNLPIRAPRGKALSCKSWQQEAALRMLMNNLDPGVASVRRI